MVRHTDGHPLNEFKCTMYTMCRSKAYYNKNKSFNVKKEFLFINGVVFSKGKDLNNMGGKGFDISKLYQKARRCLHILCRNIKKSESTILDFMMVVLENFLTLYLQASGNDQQMYLSKLII